MPETVPVFISFATPDRDQALAICEALESRGCTCWISIRDLGAGSRYGDEIVRRIKGSGALVVVLSSAANESEFVHREVERAVSYRVPVFPVRIEEVLPGPALELFISAHQWSDVWAGDFGPRMDRLARDIVDRARDPDAAASAGVAGAEPPRSEPVGTAGRGWLRRYGGLILAAAAVAVFGVLNVTGIGRSEEGMDFENAGEGDPVEVEVVQVDGATGDAETTGDASSEGAAVGTDGEATASLAAAGSGPSGGEGPGGPRAEGDDDAAPAGGGEAAEPPAATGVLVVVNGDGEGGAETAEGIILRELSERDVPTLDWTSLGPAAAGGALALDAGALAALRTGSGVALVVVGDLRTEAAPSVGGMYTGRATLSVRMYDTRTGRLAGTRSFEVGGAGSPGKIGASPMAASNEAVTQIAHQASTALAREIRQALDR